MGLWEKMKEQEKIKKNMDMTRELKKEWNMKVTDFSFSSGPQGPEKFGETKNQKKNREHQDYSIPEINLMTENSPVDMTKL